MKDRKKGIELKKTARKIFVARSDSSELKEDQKRFCKILWEAMRLRWRKLNDYGFSYRNFGSFGVMIRISDKVARLERLTKGQKAKVTDESIRDVYLDIINYSAMAILLLDQGK